MNQHVRQDTSGQPTDLRCEYQRVPLGIDTTTLRCSWKLPEDLTAQRAYALTVRAAEGTIIWESGKRWSSQPFDIVCSELPLSSFSRYSWSVRLWDEDDRASPCSEPAFFETAAVDGDSLCAQWITAAQTPTYAAGSWESGTPNVSSTESEALHYHGIYLTRTFSLSRPACEVERARAYVTGVGLYTLMINGERVGDQHLAPAQTDYRKRVLYDALCWDDLVQEHNRVTLVLGNGRHIALYGFDQPKGIVHLLIAYRDGSQEIIGTDASWLAGSGPVTCNSLFDGEEYHADTPVSCTAAAVVTSGYPLRSAGLPPIGIDTQIRPQRMWRGANGYLFDFGQNFSGYTQLQVEQPGGTSITIRYAELIDDAGELNTASNRSAAACDTYICRGGGVETWHPEFTYHGFRYAELCGYQGVPDLNTLTGWFIHTRTESAGQFICSNQDFNAIHQAIRWGQLSNLMGIPTDSPQRDERHGWLGDALLSSQEALLNFRPVAFYEKFLQDIADTQNADGSITDVAPRFWMSKPADPAWGSAFISIGWDLYWYAGDTSILARLFPSYESYITYLGTQAEGGIIEHLGTFGDWCAPGLVTSKKTGLACISSWYYLHDVRLLAQIAEVLGYELQHQRYRELAEELHRQFLERFLTGDHFESTALSPWDFPDQTSQILALSAHLLDPPAHEHLAAFLDELVTKESGDHVGTGIHGTRYLLEVLSCAGYTDKAYTIAAQESYPGWIYMLRNGATTLWERWEHITSRGMNSHNHIMLGSIDSWFYQHAAGITPLKPGWERFGCYPGTVGQLQYAKAQVMTPYGQAALGWERRAIKLIVSVTVPKGTECILAIPQGWEALIPSASSITMVMEKHLRSGYERSSYSLQPGSYVITCERGEEI